MSSDDGLLISRATSPLVQRPPHDRRQAAQMDAIVFSANTIDLCYRELIARLTAYTDGPVEGIILGAWSMVDWVHRLDGLVERCPGLSPRLRAVRAFRATSTLAKSFRHQVQHLEGTIPEVWQDGRGAFGHVVWSIDDRAPLPHFVIAFSGIAPGTAVDFETGPLLPPRSPIDHVRLFSADGQAELGLTGQHEALVRFARTLEVAMADAAPDPRDQIIRIRDSVMPAEVDQ